MFLGIHIDDQLNWKHHYTVLYNRLKLNKRMLQITKNILTTSTKKTYVMLLYIVMVAMQSQFGEASYSHTKIEKLFKLQKECVRLITNCLKTLSH